MSLPILSNEIRHSRINKGNKNLEIAYIKEIPGFKVSYSSNFLGYSIFIEYSGYEFKLSISSKYPYYPPYLECNTVKSFPSISDGRDLLSIVLQVPWSPTISLYEIVTSIPGFLSTYKSNDSIGAFTLACPMAFSTWTNKEDMGLFSGYEIDQENSQNVFERTLVITHCYLLVLQPNPHLVDIGHIVFFTHLSNVKSVRLFKKSPEIMAIEWKNRENYGHLFKVTQSKEFIKQLRMNINILQVLERNDKENEDCERIKEIDIYFIRREIERNEKKLMTAFNKLNLEALLENCQKVIEFYSAIGDQRYEKYLEKMQHFCSDPRFLHTL